MIDYAPRPVRRWYAQTRYQLNGLKWWIYEAIPQPIRATVRRLAHSPKCVVLGHKNFDVGSYRVCARCSSWKRAHEL